MRVAAVTMAYNEREFVPVWVRHYARHVGAEHCFLIDHGSDDGSTDALPGINVIRLPRTNFNEPKRCRYLKMFCDALLEYYDAVIYSDIDEIVAPDPALYPTITDYAAAHVRDVSFCVGLNIQQVTALEPALDLALPILHQRRFAWFSGTMCKPLLIRRPVDWSAGFHCCEVPLEADALYLFHLRWCDREIARQRQIRAGKLDYSEGKAAPYQMQPLEKYMAMFDYFAARPRRGSVRFDAVSRGTVADHVQRVKDSRAGRETAEYRLDLTIVSQELWPIPHRFRDAF